MNVISRDQKVTKPDLGTHSLVRFLDKFAYRKLKQDTGDRGTSIMQSIHAADNSSNIWLARTRQPKQPGPNLPMNSMELRSRRSADSALEDVFFHEYFNQASKKVQASKQKLASDDNAEDDIWEAMMEAEISSSIDSLSSDGEDDAPEDHDYADSADDSPWDDSSLGPVIPSVDVEYTSAKSTAPRVAGHRVDEGGRRAARGLRNLPTFASVEDYSHLLDDNDSV